MSSSGRKNTTLKRKKFSAVNQSHMLSKEGIKEYAISVGVEADYMLDNKIWDVIGASGEYSLKKVVEEAQKYTRAGKRARVSPEDINLAIKSMGGKSIYGIVSQVDETVQRNQDLKTLVKSKTALEAAEILPTCSIALDTLCDMELPPVPLEPAITAHWLAVEGIMPTIPQNIDVNVNEDDKNNNSNYNSKHKSTSNGIGNSNNSKNSNRNEHKQQNLINTRTGVLYHNLSEEQQVYLYRLQYDALVNDETNGKDKVNTTKTGMSTSTMNLPQLMELKAVDIRKAAIRQISCDTAGALQPLVPYLIHWIEVTTQSNLRNLHILNCLVDVAGGLIDNPNIDLELYLDRLMPSLLTCVVSKRLCQDDAKDDHWALRDHAAGIVARVCDKFGGKYPKLQLRIAKTYRKALSNPHTPWTTSYGVLIGLCNLGVRVIETVLLPRCEDFIKRLKDAMDGIFVPEEERKSKGGQRISKRVQNNQVLTEEEKLKKKKSDELKQENARKCWGALLFTVGKLYTYEGFDGSDDNNDINNDLKKQLLTLFGDELLAYIKEKDSSNNGSGNTNGNNIL